MLFLKFKNVIRTVSSSLMLSPAALLDQNLCLLNAGIKTGKTVKSYSLLPAYRLANLKPVCPLLTVLRKAANYDIIT